MKKLLIIGLSAFLLAACSFNKTTTEIRDLPSEETVSNEDELNQTDGLNEEEIQEEEANKTNADTDKTGEFVEEGLGKLKTVGVGYNDEVGIDGTDAPLKPIKMGPMLLTVETVKIYDIETDESGKSNYFNGEDNVRLIWVDMKTENTSKEDISFYPDQAIMVTDTGEQLDSEVLMMQEVGGDFLGKVKKEGVSWWIVKNMDQDIKELTFIVSPPTKAASIEELGKEKRIKFDVLPWEDALKKDEAK